VALVDNPATLIGEPDPSDGSSQPMTTEQRGWLEPDSPSYRCRRITAGVLLAGAELAPLPLRQTAVRGAITGAAAEVSVTQVFVNEGSAAIEATYVFPLPDDAAAHRLRVQVGDRTIEGVVRERRAARASYEQARLAGHGAALLEQESANIFTTAVANILPGQEVRVEITYVQPLAFQRGQYRFVFPMVVAPRYVLGSDPAAEPLAGTVPESVFAPRLPAGRLRGDAVSLELDIDAGVPLCGFDSPSHEIVVVEEDGRSRVGVALARAAEIPNRDFVLNYRVAGPQISVASLWQPPADDQPGTFAVLAVPPLAAEAVPRPRELIFVLDRSGSMSGAAIEEAKHALRQLLERLSPDDTFNIIAFNDRVELVADVPLVANDAELRRARAFLDRITARDGTEMLEPLRLALRQPAADGPPRQRTVVFLTDGSVHGELELLAALRRDIGTARIVAFGIGTAVNRHLINKLAGASRGAAEFIYPGENIARVVDRTLARLSHPVLTDVELEWATPEGGIVRRPCPDLFLDQPLFVIERFAGLQPPRVALRGRLGDQPYVHELTSADARRHAGGVRLCVLRARQSIETLMDELWEHPQNHDELRREIIALAVRFRLASEFTSFVAIEYRTPEERAAAFDNATVEIPQYAPETSETALFLVAQAARRPRQEASDGTAAELIDVPRRDRGAAGQPVAVPSPLDHTPLQRSARRLKFAVWVLAFVLLAILALYLSTA